MSNKRSYEDSDLDTELLNLTNPKKKPKTAGEVPDKKEYTESDFEDGYDDDLMGDEEDRAHLMSLTELERETIIFERHEAREKLKEAREKAIREGKLKVKTGAEIPTKSKRGRSTSYTQSSHRDVLSDIGQKRRQRRENDLRREKEANEHHARQTAKMEEERKKKKQIKIEHDDAEEEEQKSDLTLEHVRSLHLTRKMLAKWHKEHIFENIIKNGFVRLFVGYDKGQRVYRVAQVVGTKLKSRKYKFENCETKIFLELKIGKSQRAWEMSYCSNSPISQAEFDKWVRHMKRVNEKLPTAHDAVAWVKERDKEISDFRYDDESITKRLKQKELAGMKIKKNLAAEKANLQLQLELLLSEEEKKEDEIEECRRKIAEIEQQLIEEAKQFQQAMGIQTINKKIRSQNRISPTRDLKPLKFSKPKAEKLDPFARRPTRQTNWYSASSPDSTTPKTPQEKQDEAFAPSPLKSPGASLKEAHNIELNIDLDALDEPSQQQPKPYIVRPTPTSTPQPKEEVKTPKKALSVDDYKRRRGLL